MLSLLSGVVSWGGRVAAPDDVDEWPFAEKVKNS